MGPVIIDVSRIQNARSTDVDHLTVKGKLAMCILLIFLAIISAIVMLFIFLIGNLPVDKHSGVPVMDRLCFAPGSIDKKICVLSVQSRVKYKSHSDSVEYIKRVFYDKNWILEHLSKSYIRTGMIPGELDYQYCALIVHLGGEDSYGDGFLWLAFIDVTKMRKYLSTEYAPFNVESIVAIITKSPYIMDKKNDQILFNLSAYPEVSGRLEAIGIPRGSWRANIMPPKVPKIGTENVAVP